LAVSQHASALAQAAPQDVCLHAAHDVHSACSCPRTPAAAGPLPETWGSEPGARGITTIDLSSNALTSTLPASWGNMKALTHLNLSNNQLVGQLPDEWQSLTALSEL
jgi:Leucine-rich repeat (LRR) protein